MADATATTTQSEYDTKVEDVSAAKKRLTITVSSHVIDQKIEASMGTLAGQTALPGFRKGRAPKALLERRFGEAVREETRNQVIADGYSKAIEEHGLRPVSEPDPVGSIEDLELTIGKPLTFAVDVEVVPEFELPEIEGVALKKPVMHVTDEHLDTELGRQRTLAGEVQDIDDGFVEGDRLLGPATATKEGDDEPFFTHDSVDILVPGDSDGGRGHVLGLMIDGLGSKLSGKKVGDALALETVGPESHELEDIRGKNLSIEYTIRKAQHIDPAPVEQVLEQYGIATEEILREQIRVALEQRRDEEQQAAMREQVYEYLLGTVDFELPEKLSANQASRMLERQRMELLYRGGISADEVETMLAEMRSETETESRQRLKLSFLLHRLAEHFEVTVSDQEVNGRIASIAAQRGLRPEKLRTDLLQSGAIGQIATQVREHKTADRIIERAETTEITADEWNAMAEEKAAGKSTDAGAAASKKKTTKKKKKT
ncbi:MAG: trigger factor [Planctomycetes bacterium]|nr:trigger factor [Planctomycetota bacterium]